MPPFGSEALENLKPSVTEFELIEKINTKRRQVRERITTIRQTTRELGVWESPKVEYDSPELGENQVMQTWLVERRYVNTPEDRWSRTYELYCQAAQKSDGDVAPLGEPVLVYKLQNSSHRWPEDTDLNHLSLDRKLEYLGNVLDTLDILAAGSTLSG